MFFRKEYRKIDKEIERANRQKEREMDDCVVDVKLEHGEEVFSRFNYEHKSTLNDGFSDYLWKNSKMSAKGKDLTIRIHSLKPLDRKEVKSAIQNHYKEEYLEAKDEMKKTAIFSFSTLIVGILFLSLFFVFHEFVSHYIVDTVAEIIAWVFIWEAVDSFFLRRTLLRNKCRRIQRIYSAEIEIVEKLK